MTAVTPAADRVVPVGNWCRLSGSDGWTFRPAENIRHVELALYGPAAALAAGDTPFEQQISRASGLWPDGPENEQEELGYEVSPGVLGDNNQHLYGRPHYASIRLFEGELSPDSVYQVSFADTVPGHIWLHPLRSSCFTMSAAILRSPEGTLIDPVYGPASVSRTVLGADSTRFTYTGLSPGNATGLKDDYPVGEYGQRPGSHGNGDFGWFSGYSLSFRNEGPDQVAVALFVTSGFTGPSGAPTNTLANDTFWKSDEVVIPAGEAAMARLYFDDVTGYSLSDNPFPHTAGGMSAPDGTSGAAINVFDRLQISAIGWEVRSGDGATASASLVITPGETAIEPLTADEIGNVSPGRIAGLMNVAPNPSGSGTRIEYAVPRTGHVTLSVYDVRGRLVRTLRDGPEPEGTRFVSWNGQDNNGKAVASGIYFVRMTSGGRAAVRKAIVLR
jgi:hypothetical protein